MRKKADKHIECKLTAFLVRWLQKGKGMFGMEGESISVSLLFAIYSQEYAEHCPDIQKTAFPQWLHLPSTKNSKLNKNSKFKKISKLNSKFTKILKLNSKFFSYSKLENKLEIFEFLVQGRWSQYKYLIAPPQLVLT